MSEIKWAFEDGPRIFASGLYEKFISQVGAEKNFIEYYYKQIVLNNSKLDSWLWHDYERILSQINPDNSDFEDFDDILKRGGLPNSPFMELYYIKNHFFMEDNFIIKNAPKLKNIPGLIVQGRYDLICPPVNAFELSKSWDGSKLVIVNTAGHSSSDEGIIENMLDGLQKLVKII